MHKKCKIKTKSGTVPATDCHLYSMNSGITRTAAFEEKGLAEFAINVGTKCDNNCSYCSTGAMLRMHPSFQKFRRDPFGLGYSIIDPDKPSKVASDAKRIRKRGLVELCTTTDAWSPSARSYNLGRGCLEAILAEPDWTVRVLTKNSEVEDDFDLIEQYRDRVSVGLSITATADKSNVMKVIEGNASPIEERMRVMRKAHKMGLRTYAMFCPLLPGIANSTGQIDELIQFAESIGAEEIFSEAVNARGKSLTLTQQVLEEAGLLDEANSIEVIRNRKNWSAYTLELIQNLQRSVRKYSDINKLRVLLYPKGLQEEHLKLIQKDDAGVVWL